MERKGDFGNFMDFYNRQKSPIYDGKGNVTGYDHGYGRREDFDKPIPRDEYKGPGHEMPAPPRGSKPDVKYPTPPRRGKPDVGIPTPPRRDIPKDDRVYIGGPSPIRGVPGHDYVNKPEYKDHRDRQPRREIVTKPTRDLNDDRVWSGGSRDFDERTGTNRPGHRGGGYEFTQTEKGRARESRRERLRPEPKKDWWQEPRKEYRPEKSAKERRLELLTGGGGRRSSDTDRQSLLTDRGLSSNEDRMAMLTGRSDPPKEKWQSQYGGRREDSRYPGMKEYDPQDRKFNWQYSETPKGQQPWDSPNREPKIPQTNWNEDYNRLNQMRSDELEKRVYSEERRRSSNSLEEALKKAQDSHQLAQEINFRYDATERRMAEAQKQQENTTTGSETNAWGQKPLNSREIAEWNKKQEGFAKAQEDYETRLKSLENRSPIVNQPTVDLSGIKERLSQVEGKGSDWQEDRIAALEGRKPQDLSGIQGRLSELESKGPSWQEDRVKQLEGSRSESKSARNLLDQRIATLENYYKNDPPPEESTGNRYEDKMANLNKMWEQQGSTWDQVKDTQRYQDTDDDRKWSRWGQDTWSSNLPDPYVNQLRDLNREYNKPTSTAIIKGREYKSYGPRADERLSYLDKHNIHEDEYLGTGTWKNQYGQDVSGWNRGHKDRYFASHSGLDKESDEYKMRFRGLYPGWEEGQSWAGTPSDDVLKDIKERGYGSGKDYAYYG